MTKNYEESERNDSPSRSSERGPKAAADQLRESIVEAWMTQRRELEELRERTRIELDLDRRELDALIEPYEAQIRGLQQHVEAIQRAPHHSVAPHGQRAATVVAEIRSNLEHLRARLDARAHEKKRRSA